MIISEEIHLLATCTCPRVKEPLILTGIFRKLNQIKFDGTMTLELKPEEIKENLDTVKQLLNTSGFKI